jgi:hypothetical protein
MTDRRTALARLCVGSALVTLGVESANAVSETEASLQISYRNGSQRTLTFNDLNGLTQHSIVTATPWHLGTPTFTGPLLRDVLQLANFEGDVVLASAVNDYNVTIPVEDLVQHRVVLAHSINGERLTLRTLGPLYVMYPLDSDETLRTSAVYARCIWQLLQIKEP